MFHLSFLDHVHDLDVTQNNPRAAKALEPMHRSNDAFDRSMILLNHVVQIRDLPNLDGCGIVNLLSTGQHEVGSECWSETSRRILGDVGKFAPRLEPGCELFAIN